MTIRKSQQTMFWRNHKIWEIRINGKRKGWIGKRFPKIAQEIVEESE